MNHSVIRKLFIFSLIFISGCQITAPKPEEISTSEKTTTSGECPEQPEVVLNSQSVQAIALENKQATLSGIARKNKSLGYTFDAKSGQKLSYQTDDNICVWIYTPNNQLLNSKNLPVDGKYTIQVSAPKGSASFDLNIGLDFAQTSSSINQNISRDNSSKSQQLKHIQERPSADDFVRQYYIDIINRNYKSSWNKLSPKFKYKLSGYLDYQDWWNSIRQVRIGNINLIKQTSTNAVVDTDLVYVMNTGKYFQDPKTRIYLIWDESSNSWLFEQKI